MARQERTRAATRWRALGVLWPVAIVLVTVWMAVVVRHAARPVVGVALGVATVSLLWIQRRAPLVTFIGAFAGFLLTGELAGFDGPDDPFIVVILWASFGVGRYARVRHQPWAAAGTLFFLSLNLLAEELNLPADVVFPVLFTAFPWLLGLSVQLAKGSERRARDLAREVIELQEDLLRRATEDERLRLARELHDVAAHTMSTVSLHAQVLRRRVEAGAPAGAEDLRIIETSAQQAMAELRRVVGVLRPSDGAVDLSPQPQIEDLPRLAEECRGAGQDVDVMVRGAARPLPGGLSLAAFRIVQEALSNARQHGATGPASVEASWDDETLRLCIANPAGTTRGSTRKGHGLIGMAERAELYGGSFAAGPDASGRWVVDVRLPIPVSTHA